MIIEEVLKVTNGELLCGNKQDSIENFYKDSREQNANSTFVAIVGENFDGNDFVEMAIQNGAKNCIISRKIKPIEGVNLIYVEDTLTAIQQIATYKREKSNVPVVAVTGSVGKTSTKDLIAAVLSEKFKVLKTQGNMNNDIGLPFTILNLKDEEIMVIEMGMNHFGEIRKLTNIAKPNLAVITNIGTAHIGILGSRENILKAKLEILEGLQGDSIVINNDNDLLQKWGVEDSKYNKLTYGINNKDSKYIAENIEAFADKSTFTLKSNDEGNGKNVIVPVGGEHFVLNSLCAIAVGRYFGMTFDEIIKGISELELTKKRMELVDAKCGAIVINDTYNANFDSMKAALEYLKGVKNRRKIAVLGDMLELGEFSKELHENVGKCADNIDVLVTVGKEAKYIAKMSKAKEIYEFDNNEDAINQIKEIINKDDIILVKASNGMKFIDIVNQIKEF